MIDFTLARMVKAPEYLWRALRYYLAGKLFIPKPKKFYLRVTDRCNSACVMCSFWQKKPGREPTVSEIQGIFANRLLNQLQTVAIGGGEAILRQDLSQIVQVILAASAGVEKISILSNGLAPDLLEEQVTAIMALPEYRRLKRLEVILSLDGIGETHDKIRGVNNAYAKLLDSIAALKRIQTRSPFDLKATCTVQRSNLADLPLVFKLGQERGIHVSFRPVTHKISAEDGLWQTQMLGAGEIRTLEKMFSEQIDLQMIDAVYWPDYFRVMRGERRQLPCAIPYASVLLTPEGDLYSCGRYDQVGQIIYGNVYEQEIDRIWYSKQAEKIRHDLRSSLCLRCESPCEVALSLGEEVFYFARHLLRKQIRSFLPKSEKNLI